MIKNTKGNKSYTRPLPIRMLAILMAVVMVLSVLYINNSKGIVRAEGGVDNTYLGSIMILDSAKEVTDGKVFIDPGEYDVHFRHQWKPQRERKYSGISRHGFKKIL